MSFAGIDDLIQSIDGKISEYGSNFRTVNNFRVENGILYRTSFIRAYCSFYLPRLDSDMLDACIKRGEPLVAEDTAYEAIDELNDGIDEGEPYKVDELFEEIGAEHYYTVREDFIPVSAVIKEYEKRVSTDPFTVRFPSLVELFNSAIDAENVSKRRISNPLTLEEGKCVCALDWTGEFDEDLNSALTAYPEHYQKAVRDYLDNQKTSFASMIDCFNEQQGKMNKGVTFYSPFNTSATSFNSLWEQSGSKVTAESFVKALSSLPELNGLKDIGKNIVWGADYDSDKKVLFCTLNGQRFEHSRNPLSYKDYVAPEVLSVAFSGLCNFPKDNLLYAYLMREEGKDDLARIKSLLPEPKAAFEKMVNDKLGSSEFQLITDGDMPHGLYLSKDEFIPLSEVMKNQTVFHVLSARTACRSGDLIRYTCFTEYVKEGESYLSGRGWEGETEKTEDRIYDYPDHCTELYLKGDEIAQTVRFEGKKIGEVGIDSDVKNKGIDYDHKVDSLVSGAATAAALFKYRDILLSTMRQA